MPAQAGHQHLQHDLGFPVQLALEGQLGVRQRDDGIPAAARAKAAGGVERLAGGKGAAALGDAERLCRLGLGR